MEDRKPAKPEDDQEADVGVERTPANPAQPFAPPGPAPPPPPPGPPKNDEPVEGG